MSVVIFNIAEALKISGQFDISRRSSYLVFIFSILKDLEDIHRFQKSHNICPEKEKKSNRKHNMKNGALKAISWKRLRSFLNTMKKGKRGEDDRRYHTL